METIKMTAPGWRSSSIGGAVDFGAQLGTPMQNTSASCPRTIRVGAKNWTREEGDLAGGTVPLALCRERSVMNACPKVCDHWETTPYKSDLVCIAKAIDLEDFKILGPCESPAKSFKYNGVTTKWYQFHSSTPSGTVGSNRRIWTDARDLCLNKFYSSLIEFRDDSEFHVLKSLQRKKPLLFFWNYW